MGPVPIERAVGVVGAGTMGAGIAQVAASAGHDVYLHDMRPGAAQTATEQAGLRLHRMAEKELLSPDAAGAAARRLHPVETLEELRGCALVVEAILEDLGAKQQLFVELERVCAPEAILTTNTSTIPVTEIAAPLSRPQRLCGMHFFNPAPRMQLVEVPAGAATDPAVADTVVDTARAWGKTAVRCACEPGFIVNRVARPFYGEAQRIVEEGMHDCYAVDAAMRAVGFRMGPFELADLIGNDVNLAATISVWEQTGHDARYAPTAIQQRLVEAGRLGRKSGHGWYDYTEAVRIEAAPDARISTRILAMLVNEAAALVDRGGASAADVDVAMRLGMNYPKGPLEWGDEIGSAALVQVLDELHQRHPTGRYRLAARLQRAALGAGSLRA